MGNSRDDYCPFVIIYSKNKVGYLHRQPTSNVLYNNLYYEKQQFILDERNIVIRKVAYLHRRATL